LTSATTASSAGAEKIGAEPAALLAIRVIGVGYLLWLGFSTLRSARRSSTGKDVLVPTGRNLVARGMMTNLANPKIVVFFVAFLPQFVRPAGSPVSLQLLTLGGLFLMIGLAVDSLVALTAGHLRLALRPGGRMATGLSITAGIVLCVLAAALAVEAA